jgi:hypothetical protein
MYLIFGTISADSRQGYLQQKMQLTHHHRLPLNSAGL